MKPTIEQMQEALQNAANRFNLTVRICFETDKRKNSTFIICDGNVSISPKMDYIQSNMFLIGYGRATNKLNK